MPLAWKDEYTAIFRRNILLLASIAPPQPPKLDSNTLGMGINTCCTLTHTHTAQRYIWMEQRLSAVFQTHHPWAEEKPAAESCSVLLLVPSLSPFLVFHWLFWVLTHQRPALFFFFFFLTNIFEFQLRWFHKFIHVNKLKSWDERIFKIGFSFIRSLLCGIKSRCCVNKMWPRVWMCVNEGCGSLNVKMWHSEEEKEGFSSISSPNHWTFLYSDAYLEPPPYVLCLQWCSCSFAIICINYIPFQRALELAWLKPETIRVFPWIFFDSHVEDLQQFE